LIRVFDVHLKSFIHRILVLKDGQVVEQGSHKALLALDGIFASMWADQVSSDDPSHSIDDTSMKREVSGYIVEELEPAAVEHDRVSPVTDSSAVMFSADVDVVPEPSLADEARNEQHGHAESPALEMDASDAISDSIDPPTSSAPAAESLAFPTADISSPPVSEPIVVPSQGPAVTFGEDVNPPRTGTPDAESEPKRKRISSQNFQRLARRISLTTRRQSSASILPSLKRDSSPRVSTEGRGEGSLRTESPAGSIKGDTDKGKSKRDKKEKSKKAS
jgi:hypothetical protein